MAYVSQIIMMDTLNLHSSVCQLPLSKARRTKNSVVNYRVCTSIHQYRGFPDSSNDKESACSAGGLGSILVSRRSPGEGHGYPLQCSCLENPMDRGAWWATVHRVTCC